MNNKIIVIISAVILVLLLVAGGYFLFLRRPADDALTRGRAGDGSFPSGESVVLPGADDQFPAGTEEGAGEEGAGAGADEATATSLQKVLTLVQLTPSAISGAGLACADCIVSSDGRLVPANNKINVATTTIRYVEKSTGHIYEINFDGTERKRVTSSALGSSVFALRSFDSFWSSKGDKFIMRLFEEDKPYPRLKNYLGVFDKATASSVAGDAGTTTSLSVKGVFLPLTVKEVAVSPYEDRIFYLDSNGGGIEGITSDYENKKQKSVFSSPFAEFGIDWLNKDTVSLLTKPSASMEGFLYIIDLKTNKMEKVLGNVSGLTVLISPDAGSVIYSQALKDGTGFETKLLNRKDKTSAVFSLNVPPEKCVWSKTDKTLIYCAFSSLSSSAKYPDDWYQGLTSFNDTIWRVDVSTGKTEILTGIQNTTVDVVKPFLSPYEDYLFFTNKRDSTLWGLRLK